MMTKKTILAVIGGAMLFGAGLLIGATTNRFTKPQSLLHVVTFAFRPDSTPEQRAAAMKGVEKMAGDIQGVTRIWTDAIKVQGPFCPASGNNPASPEFTHSFVMEFKDEAAFKLYADHPSHKEWEKVYLPVRAESRTHDVTNKPAAK